MDDLTALHAAILRDPSDDVLRLAYADELDERDTVSVPCVLCKGAGKHRMGYVKCDARGIHDTRQEFDCKACSGTGTVPDTSNRERAEFIRLQCEISRTADHGHGVNAPHGGACPLCLRLAQLGKRERGLCTALRSHFRALLPSPRPRCHEWGLYLSRHEDETPDDYTISLDRGFPCKVTCETQGFLAHAETIFCAHPVTTARLSDREPQAIYEGVLTWLRAEANGGALSNSACIPEAVFSLLEDDDQPTGFHGGYISAQRAHAALSAALVNYGRRLAGLPPLPLGLLPA